MPDDTDAVQLINNLRERGSRTSLSTNARLGADYQARQNDPGTDAGDATGYYDGDTYVSYFRFGISKFGDGSVFK